MSRLIILNLTGEERAALEKGFRHGKSHAFRTRCHMILLKADCLPSAQVAERVGCCMMAVNGWVTRYRAEGIDGLKTKPGRGRRPILDDHADLPRRPCRPGAGARRRAEPPPEDQPRQKISLARAELEADLGKEFSAMTLKRFLKNIAAATSD
jgi:transposase